MIAAQVQMGDASTPAGWVSHKLVEVCRIVSGSTPSSLVPSFWNGDICWITPTDLGRLKGIEIHSSQRQITDEGFQSSNVELVPPGSVVLSSRAPIGHLGIASVPLCTNQGCKSFIPSEEIDSLFLYFALKQAVPALQALGSGATFTEVSKSQLESFELDFPPLREQRRIAAKLSEQIEAIESAGKAAEEQLAAAQALPAAYLRDVFETPAVSQWEMKRLGHIASIVQNGIYKPAEFYGQGHPFLRMYNLRNDHWALDNNRLALIQIDEKEAATFSLDVGDLLVSRVNSFELIGKCAWVDSGAEGFVFENMLIRVRLDNSVNPLFVAQQFGTPFIRSQIQAVAKRAIGQASINSSDLKALYIHLPSLIEQEKIAKEIDARVAHSRALVDQLRSQLKSIRILQAALLRSVFAAKCDSDTPH